QPVQRIQCAFGRAERVRGSVHERVAVGGGDAVVTVADRRYLRAVPAAGVFDRAAGADGLADLRGGRELGVVGEGEREALWACEEVAAGGRCTLSETLDAMRSTRPPSASEQGHVPSVRAVLRSSPCRLDRMFS